MFPTYKFIFSKVKVISNVVGIRNLNRNIPRVPVCSAEPIPVEVKDETIQLLEKLSLVDFANPEGVRRLNEAISFALPILDVDTKSVEPMFSVLQDETLRLRNDEVTEGNCLADILHNAVLTEEDYFVAPPGNIPLASQTNKYKDQSEEVERTL